MNRDKYILVRNLDDADMDMWHVIYGISGIADALYDHEEDYAGGDAEAGLFSALKLLSEQLLTAASSVEEQDKTKMRALLTEPDSRAEALSKKLLERGRALLEHTAAPGSFAVLEPQQGTLEMQMNSIDGIEDWLEQNAGSAS